MRVIVLGSDGFLGKNLATNFEGYGFIVLRVNRLVISFGAGNEHNRLKRTIEDFSPDVIINALGGIDDHLEASGNSIFNSIFILFLHFICKFAKLIIYKTENNIK